jgi:hypothetical protein
LDPASDLLEMG